MRGVKGALEAEAQIHSAAAALFAGPGDIRALCRALDWARTPLGPVETWPEPICSTVRLSLDSGLPMCVYAGPEFVAVYNDEFVKALGDGKHPHSLGSPAGKIWPEVWERIAPELNQVMTGTHIQFRDQRFLLERDGRTEETFWTYAFSPVRGSDGSVLGVHGVGVETTARVRTDAALRESEREYRTLLTEMDQGFCVIEKVDTVPGAPVDFRYLVVNPAFGRHTGLYDVVGRTIRELVPKGEESTFRIYDDVVRTGERVEFESYVAALDMWMAAEAAPTEVPGQLSVLFSNVSARKRAELALRESDERQAFLLKLTDALRPLGDPAMIQQAASQALGEQLGVERVGYGELENDRVHLVVARDWSRDGLSSTVGRFKTSEFGAAWTAPLYAGQIAAVENAQTDLRLSADEYERSWAAIGVRAAIAVPIVKDGEFVAALFVQNVAPRCWTGAETALVAEVAQRTWAEVLRARAEAALRDSESKLAIELNDTQLLYRISSSLIKENDADALYSQFLDGARSLMRTEMASLQMLAHERNELLLIAQHGLAPESAEFWERVDAGETTACGLAFASGKPVIVRDVELWDFVAGTESLKHYRLCGMRSMLSVPLIARDGHLVGVISTHWREVHEPSERELRLLTVLARQAANLIEWRAAEKVLRETEARYRILVDNVLDYAIMLLDADGIITEWTPGAERVKGYAAEDILGRHFRIFYQESDRDGGVPEHELDRAAELGRAENEGWRVRKDGTRFWADEILTAVCDKRGTVTGFTKITRDLTHRMLVESAAERQRQDSERDDYRRQVVAAEENERRRLARELHDQLGQHLAALALGLDEIRRMIGDDTGDRGAGSNDGGREGRSRVASRLHALQGLTTTMTIDARNLALELRPPELDDVGLASALETLVSRWSARTRIAADLEVSGLAGKAVAPDAGTAIYRIVQEALTNVVKHAAAERVSIIVKPTHAGVRLIVEDDGCGFDPATALKRARMDSRLGIAGMRERATLTGGTIAVESEPGSGTTIYVTIPAAIHDGAADNGTAHPGTTHNNEVAAPQVLS